MNISKETMGNLVKWEGFRKELPWILFIIFVVVAAEGYNSDIKQCRTMMVSDCYLNCRLEAITGLIVKENPGIEVKCWVENKTRQIQCEMSGVKELSDDMKNSLEQLKGVNISDL